MALLMEGLEAEAYDKTYGDRELLRRVLVYFSPQKYRMLAVSGITVLQSLCETALPIYIARSLDALVGGTVTLPVVAAVVLGLGGLGWICTYVRRVLAARVVNDVVLHLREDAIGAVLAGDLSFFDRFAGGKVVSRVNSDTEAFAQVVVLAIDFSSQILLIGFLVAYLFATDTALTWTLLAFAPLIAVAALAFRHVARKRVTESRRVGASLSAHFQECLSGIAVAKAFRQEQCIYDEFLAVNALARRTHLRTGYAFSSIFPVLNTLVGVGRAVVAYSAGVAVGVGRLSVGDWYLFLEGVQMFWFPLTGVASFWSQFQQGLAAAERVFALIDAESSVVQTGALELSSGAKEVRFEEVKFGYVPERIVLPLLNLSVRAGETVALVGESGAGKSSVAKLLARFYEYQEGRILIGGQDIRSIEMTSLRSQFGFVTQTPFLFLGSVRENIRYGNLDASDAEVEKAAFRVGGGDWIRSLPEGLDTQVGERGGRLSMGQRQLVALARVELQDPAIIILDEATASVDPYTEALIQEGVNAVIVGRGGEPGLARRTAIVIAHRLSTVMHSDRIVVLHKGRVLEQGNHETLVASGGHYAGLYAAYFRHQSLEFIEGSLGGPSEPTTDGRHEQVSITCPTDGP